ncbi:helix-turn-helix domain-containing protein [Streptomyces chartreusis]|uniref:Helix-turn-helix transcriptional regulator n=1 Tax=Streptomyces chartreusis TaxID=1969 RepID=A0A7H8TF81_STRCX|nr:helix-turn-helix transcriptional regulator [Streptomyces chartreusis]QKZ22065.1 helix-turn-helix transcriptional regulator [Streptomyces chartreusis]
MKLDGVGQAFGALVRQAREDRQWTQADLAKRLGALLGKEVNPLAITRTEAGSRPVPFDEVAAFAQVLNLELDPLINPPRSRGSADDLKQRAAELRDQLNQAHQQEVQAMAAEVSARQQVTRVRALQRELERELQAVERAVRDAD